MFETISDWRDLDALRNKVKDHRISISEIGLNTSVFQDLSIFNNIPSKHTWKLKLVFKKKHPNAGAIFKLLWLLSSSLESIPGVKVTLNSWYNGSKYVDLDVSADNVSAHQEVKQVLENVRKSTKNERNQSVAPRKTSPVEMASDVNNESVSTSAPGSSKKTISKLLTREELENQFLKAQIESLKQDNLKKRIENYKAISELVANDLASKDNLEIWANDLLFYKKEDGVVDYGEPIDSIANNVIKEKNT